MKTISFLCPNLQEANHLLLHGYIYGYIVSVIYPCILTRMIYYIGVKVGYINGYMKSGGIDMKTNKILKALMAALLIATNLNINPLFAEEGETVDETIVEEVEETVDELQEEQSVEEITNEEPTIETVEEENSDESEQVFVVEQEEVVVEPTYNAPIVNYPTDIVIGGNYINSSNRQWVRNITEVIYTQNGAIHTADLSLRADRMIVNWNHPQTITNGIIKSNGFADVAFSGGIDFTNTKVSVPTQLEDSYYYFTTVLARENKNSEFVSINSSLKSGNEILVTAYSINSNESFYNANITSFFLINDETGRKTELPFTTEVIPGGETYDIFLYNAFNGCPQHLADAYYASGCNENAVRAEYEDHCSSCSYFYNQVVDVINAYNDETSVSRTMYSINYKLRNSDAGDLTLGYTVEGFGDTLTNEHITVTRPLMMVAPPVQTNPNPETQPEPEVEEEIVEENLNLQNPSLDFEFMNASRGYLRFEEGSNYNSAVLQRDGRTVIRFATSSAYTFRSYLYSTVANYSEEVYFLAADSIYRYRVAEGKVELAGKVYGADINSSLVSYEYNLDNSSVTLNFSNNYSTTVYLTTIVQPAPSVTFTREGLYCEDQNYLKSIYSLYFNYDDGEYGIGKNGYGLYPGRNGYEYNSYGSELQPYNGSLRQRYYWWNEIARTTRGYIKAVGYEEVEFDGTFDPESYSNALINRVNVRPNVLVNSIETNENTVNITVNYEAITSDYWMAEYPVEFFLQNTTTNETTELAAETTETGLVLSTEVAEGTYAFGYTYDDGSVITDTVVTNEAAMTPVHEHVDASNKGICDECSEIIDGIAGFKTKSLVLNGAIEIKVRLIYTENTLNDPNATVTFNVNDRVVTYNLTDGKRESANVYSYTIDVYAKEMSIPVEFYVTSNGIEGKHFTYSAKQYLIDLHNVNYSNTKLLQLVESMLNYGAYTQLYMNVNTDDLANSANTNTTLGDVNVEDLAKYQSTQSIASNCGISKFSKSLVLETVTLINFYVKFNSGTNIGNYVFKLNGEIVNPTIDGNSAKITTPGIYSNHLGDTYTLTVEMNGKVVASISYCAYSYIYSVLTSNVSESLKNCMKSLYFYGQEAEAYFGK